MSVLIKFKLTFQLDSTDNNIMPELPPTQSPLESNSANTNESFQTPSKLSRFNPIYLWQHKRWLFLAYVSGIIITLLGIILIGLFAYTQMATNQSGSEPPTSNQSDDQPAATHDSSDDTFFANQPLTVLYYSFAQTTGNKNMYQATPTDHENRVLNIGFPDKYRFVTAPDGAWLLRWDDTTIERSAAATPQKFSSIFKLDDKDQKITSVIWQSDTAAIAIAISQVENQTQDSSQRKRVKILPFVTLQSVTVLDELHDYNLELVKFPTANTLYFIEDHHGDKRNLTLFNPQSKAVDRQFTSLNQNNLLASLQFSADMHWAFQTTPTQIIRYDLQTMEQSVVYEVGRHCEGGDPNNNTVAYASVAPSGNLLFVTENLTPCSRQSRGRSTEPTPVPHTRQSTFYSIAEQKIISQEYNLDLPQLSTSAWSPKEDYMWLSIDTQQTYIASVSKLALWPIPTPDRHTLTKERVFITGWLQVKE